jgi:hypothetical protein
MESERFSVPELLFHPSDVDIQQSGLAEATGHCVGALEEVSLVHISNTGVQCLDLVYLLLLAGMWRMLSQYCINGRKYAVTKYQRKISKRCHAVPTINVD